MTVASDRRIVNYVVNNVCFFIVFIMDEFKKNFEKELFATEFSTNSSTIKDEESYLRLVNEVLESKKKLKKTPKDYRRINRYDVLYANSEAKLVSPQNSEAGGIKFYVHNGQLFDILRSVHEECGHGGLHKMENAVQLKYANVSRPVIMMFLRRCETCHRKRVHPKKGVVVQPLLFKEINARGQVDLIDFQSCKDGEFKFVLNYQDHLSKFVNLRGLKTKTAAEVAYHLIDIFCVFGAPSVLQSDNGKEFVNSIINELHLMWPSLKIVHGKPRHSQSQGSIERANRDVGDMIRAWMSDNNSKKWHEGLRFVQFHKNNSHHEGIKQSPFEAMFGRRAALGLGSTLPAAIAHTLESEDDLRGALTTTSPLKSSATIANAPLPSTSCIENTDVDDSSDTSDNESNTMRRNLRSDMEKNRKRAIHGLEKQAKRMKFASDAKFKVLERGTTVTLPVPDVDRSKCNLRNIIGVVMEIVDDAFYRIGTKDGILPQLFSRGQIAPCTSTFLKIDDVPATPITVREANAKSSVTGGQGFLRCACTTKCSTNRCACRKKNVQCNSRCHNSMSCSNK